MKLKVKIADFGIARETTGVSLPSNANVGIRSDPSRHSLLHRSGDLREQSVYEQGGYVVSRLQCWTVYPLSLSPIRVNREASSFSWLQHWWSVPLHHLHSRTPGLLLFHRRRLFPPLALHPLSASFRVCSVYTRAGEVTVRKTRAQRPSARELKATLQALFQAASPPPFIRVSGRRYSVAALSPRSPTLSLSDDESVSSARSSVSGTGSLRCRKYTPSPSPHPLVDSSDSDQSGELYSLL